MGVALGRSRLIAFHLILFLSGGLLAYPYDWATGVVDSSCTVKDICPHLNKKTRVRPPTSYTNKLKAQQLKKHPEIDCTKGCEEDHVISIEICGSTIDPGNLAPEPYYAPMGAHEKDRVENYLHKQVCSGTMTLQEAQHEIVFHWMDIYADLEAGIRK